MIKELIFGIIGGLGLFIYGIWEMSEGLHKISGERMRRILHNFTGHPIKGVLVGAGITSLIQSSSATTVMVVGFVNAGLMTLVQALGVIFGANIGTTITAQLAALGANLNARRAAMAHTFFNVIGVAYMLVFMTTFFALCFIIFVRNRAVEKLS